MDGVLKTCVEDRAHGAGYAWNKAVGTVERAHTMGLYLEKRDDGAPVLHVYVDSSSLLQDFTTDHLLYERRLAAVGFPVERVVFSLSRKAGQRTRAAEALAAQVPTARIPQGPLQTAPALSTLPDLTPEELSFVECACAPLPDGLKEEAQNAMKASIRRAKGRGPEGGLIAP